MSDASGVIHPISDLRLARLPIFPLPEAQLFPDAVLPLHVFEPRYRALVEHALQHGNAMGVATLRPGYQGDYEGRPAVHPVMGAGLILAADKQDDGRWNILVRGFDRVRIIEEHAPTQLFREVRAVRLDEVGVAAGHPLEERLRSLVAELAMHAEQAARALHLILSQAKDAGALTNLIAAHACSNARLRLRMLECTDVEERLELACGHMARLLLDVMEAPSGQDTLH
ncbi:MAG: LON peptidase substrate-binding domain-containing protein [Myxococcales bacterium]|nr:LON peptidase substrate-binding domain-containing protein [Myxococcales bacterium]